MAFGSGHQILGSTLTNCKASEEGNEDSKRPFEDFLKKMGVLILEK